MSISVNGSADPTSISFNGTSLTAVYARQGPSGTYVQVWPSQFTLTMTGNSGVLTQCSALSPECYNRVTINCCYWWSSGGDSSTYQLQATGLPATVTSWDVVDIHYPSKPTLKVECICVQDEAGCDMGVIDVTIPKECYDWWTCNWYCSCGCCRFKNMFPNNFTGEYSTNLDDSDSYNGWTLSCWCINYGSIEMDQFRCSICTHIFNCSQCTGLMKDLITAQCGDTWGCAYVVHDRPTVIGEVYSCWKLQATLANGQVYKSENYITNDTRTIVMKPV